MADANPPAASEQLEQAPELGKPLTEQEAVDSIAELLGEDPPQADPRPAAKEVASEAASEPDPLGDDEDEVVETEEAPAEPDGSPDGGQYVSPKAKYKLADGSEITVGELARNNLFHRDYSRKTEALKRETTAFETKVKEVDQLSKTLSDERQYLIWFAENHAPKPPKPPTASAVDDPMGHLTYAEEQRKYQTFVESWRQFKAGQDNDAQRKAGETQQQANQRAAREVTALFERVKIDPKDQAKAKTFLDALAKGGKEYFGLTENDIASALKQDHRFGLVLRTAVRAMQNKKAAPDVQETLSKVPKMVRTPTARATPNQQQARQREEVRERQRRTGSDEDAIARLSLIPDL